MDSFELNKIIGALLGTIFVVFSVSILSDVIFASPPPHEPGYAIVVEEGDEFGEGDVQEDEAQPIGPLIAEADPAQGENIFKRCQSCHTVEEGGANKVGPNLWDVVDRPIASHEGFSYSAAMTDFAEGGEVTWTYEHLDGFLTKPKAYISGTAMAFAGLAKAEDRAAMLAYLRTLSNDPVPLPEPEAEAEPAASAEATDGAAPAATDGGADAPAAEDGEGGTTAEEPAAQEDAETSAQDDAAPAEETPAEQEERPAADQ